MVFFDNRIKQLQFFITSFLNNPKLYKLKDIDDEFSLFGVQIESSSKKEKLFIICKCKKRSEKELHLQNIPWVTFQTRTISDNTPYDELPKIPLFPNFHSSLKSIAARELATNFNNIIDYDIGSDSNIHISLLNAEKKTDTEITNLQELVNTFDCIINLKV